MNQTIADFIDRLGKLQPESAANPVGELYDVVEMIERMPDAPQAFPAIFNFLENHPNADHGAPGPLVHLIEKHRGTYEGQLFDSVRRAPMPTTLSMVNSLLNSDLQAGGRRMWLDVLVQVQRDASLAQEIRDEAGRYIRYQGGMG